MSSINVKIWGCSRKFGGYWCLGMSLHLVSLLNVNGTSHLILIMIAFYDNHIIIAPIFAFSNNLPKDHCSICSDTKMCILHSSTTLNPSPIANDIAIATSSPRIEKTSIDSKKTILLFGRHINGCSVIIGTPP